MLENPGLDEEAVFAPDLMSWPRIDQARILVKILRSPLGVRRARHLTFALLERFGSLPAILAAEPQLLKEVPGVGLATIRLLAATLEAGQKMARLRIYEERLPVGSWQSLQNYLHIQMAYRPVEQLRILFLDKKNRLIADEVQQTGTVDHTPVYPREVIKRSLELSATALILVHNHPSGDPSPSSADIRMTREIADIAKPLGIILHDHIIIGKSGHASLRGLRLF